LGLQYAFQTDASLHKLCKRLFALLSYKHVILAQSSSTYSLARSALKTISLPTINEPFCSTSKTLGWTVFFGHRIHGQCFRGQYEPIMT